MARSELIPSHPFADLFPLDDGDNLHALADDLKENGQRQPAWTFDGKLLDGRRRQLACKRAGIPFKTKAFKGTEDAALAFAVSMNLHRRHLSTGDRALIAANVARMPRGGDRRSEDFKGSKEPLKTNDEAASLLNVSTSSVKRAATVLENGTPAVQKAVKAGQVTVTDAAAVVSEPAKVQNAAVKAVCDGEAKTLREAVELNGKPEEGPPAPKDSEGHEVPQATADVFANVEKFDALISLCRQLQKGIDELVRLPGGEQLRMQTKPTGSADKQIFKTEELESLKRHLKFTRPHSICPYCAGQAKAGCRCSGRGWIDSVAWKNVEATDKAKLEVVA